MKLKIVAVVTVILLLVVMYVPVYADTPVPDPPSDAWEYWVITGSTTQFACWSSHNPITVKYNQYGSLVLKLQTQKLYRYEDGNWTLQNEQNYGTEYGYFTNIWASNHDIAWDDGSGFFFLRPKVTPLSQGMKETDFGTILRTFSAGLIPVLGLLILVISLRKGWEFLRTQLKH